MSCSPLKKPCFVLPTTYLEVEENQEASSCKPELCCFWEGLQDPLLNQLIERGLACNLDLEIARERILEARGILGIRTGALFPHINSVTSYERIRNSLTLDDTPILGGNYASLFTTGIDAFWEIDLFGKNYDKRRAALYELIATLEKGWFIKLTVSTEIIRYYLTLRSIQAQIKIAKDHIASTKDLLALTEDRFQSGYAPKLNVYSSQALLETRKAVLAHLEAKLKSTIYGLAVLIKDLPENLSHRFDPPKAMPTAVANLSAGLPCELLSCRPDIREKEFLMQAAGAYVMAARKELLPNLSLSGFYGFASGFFSKWCHVDSQAFTFFPKLCLPLFHGGAIWSHIIATTARQRQAVFAYEKSVLEALQEVETALISHLKEKESSEALQKTVNSYRESKEMALSLFTTGFVDFLYVMNMETDLFIAENFLIESKLSAMLYLIGFYKALGGGIKCLPSL